MKRMELSINIDYVSDWDMHSGIREFISNARDAEIQFDAPMTIDWTQNQNANDEDKRIGTLRIENRGTILPREALLFGHTTKANMSDMVGKFGEGFKIGSLCLIRNGYSVKIKSGSEVWEPAIERSDKFKADVLVFNIHENRKYENRVRVEIGGISKEVYDSLKEKFLFLDDRLVQVKTQHGSLLLGSKYAGKIFVKGVYVQQTDFVAGYDLSNASLDRDRKMVDSYDLKHTVRNIWTGAIETDPSLCDVFLSMLNNQSDDVSGIDSYVAQYLPAALLDVAAKQFTQDNGDDGVPCNNIEECRDIEHYGKKGVIVSRALGAVLSNRLGDFNAIKAKFRDEVKKTYSWDELDATEHSNINFCMDALKLVDSKVDMSVVDIVDFASVNLNGLHKDHRVLIAKKNCKDKGTFMKVAIHEFAHYITDQADGAKGHVSKIEDMWMNVYQLK